MVMLRTMLSFVLLGGVASTALAQSNMPRATEQMGTPEQRAACRADVRRFCRSVNPENGPLAYHSCLQANRAKLRKKCAKVIGGK